MSGMLGVIVCLDAYATWSMISVTGFTCAPLKKCSRTKDRQCDGILLASDPPTEYAYHRAPHCTHESSRQELVRLDYN